MTYEELLQQIREVFANTHFRPPIRKKEINMQGNQPITLNAADLALTKALDFHITCFNCTGCLQLIELEPLDNLNNVYLFCCLTCSKIICATDEYEKADS